MPNATITPARPPRCPSRLAARRRAGATATALATASLLALCGASAAAASDCSAPGQQRSASVARADRPDGTSEVTEFLVGGGYRVTRCARDGALLVSQTVSPIADPDGGVTLVPTEREVPGVHVSALYGDPAEPAWARGFRAARDGLRAAVIAPTAPEPAAPAPAAPGVPAPPAAAPPAADPPAAGAPSVPDRADPAPGRPWPPRRDPGRGERTPRAPRGGQVAQAAVASDACTNPQYAVWLSAWVNRSYAYSVNRSRFNYNDTTVASIVAGHRNWDTTYNSCGLNDVTNLTSQHLGSTSATVHTYPDGQSVTDRGDLASVGCAGALACTWLFSNGAGASTETDQRFSQDVTFTNSGAAGAYDYESVATHESGHSIGLDHANSSDALTMYYSIRPGTTYARTLAKGDVLGLRARYP